MRATLLLVCLFALVAPGAAVGRVSQSVAPVPAEVQEGLAADYIGVVDARDPAPGLAVSAKRAVRVAKHSFNWSLPPKYSSGWSLATPLTVHLVRITALPSASIGSTDRLYVGDLAWLVVIWNAVVPSLGPPHPGRPRPLYYVQPVVVFVQTTKPHWVMATTI